MCGVDEQESIVVAPREGRVSRNGLWDQDGEKLQIVAPREGRVSRNAYNKVLSGAVSVAPREGRVSRNVGIEIPENALLRSRPARGV